jgi:hypothetical protein
MTLSRNKWQTWASVVSRWGLFTAQLGLQFLFKDAKRNMQENILYDDKKVDFFRAQALHIL